MDACSNALREAKPPKGREEDAEPVVNFSLSFLLRGFPRQG